METKKKWMPLHYQIFLALIIGAVVGLLVNPGETSLEDAQVTLSPDGDGVSILEMEPDGLEGYRDTLENRKELENRYRDASKTYTQTDPPVAVTLEVTHRNIHFTEELEKITVRYSRLYDGKKVESNPRFASVGELKKTYPQFAEEYDTYSESFSRLVTISAKEIGDLFLRLLRMITVPLIIVSLVTGVSSLGSSRRLGAMFGKTLLYYLCTSLLAITTGIMMVNLLKPGIGTELPGGGSGSALDGEQSLPGVFMRLLNNMIPPNPIHAMANGEFLSIITFSILLGLFIIKVGGKSGQTLRDVFQSGFDVMMEMTMFIIKLAPIGVLSFMLYATASQGLSIFSTFGWYMLTVFLALMVHACVVLPLILLFVARRSPWKFAQAMSPALLTAFSTASSNGTLPLTITSVEERAGVSNRVSSFVLPLGATINMDGTALYEAVAVLFIAQAYNGFVMPLEQQVIVAVTALLASVGAAGIPSAGLVMMAIVLQAVGLPLEAQGLIIAVDRVLDMCRTSVNVWSDSCGCAVLEQFEGGID